jgi:hypothetical protein
MTKPNIKTMDRVQVGTTDSARMVESIIHTGFDGNVGAAFAAVAERCGVTPWAVYRWLRGDRVPRGGSMLLLAQMAESLVHVDRVTAEAG